MEEPTNNIAPTSPDRQDTPANGLPLLPLTVASLAAAKGFTEAELRAYGLRDLEDGVAIPYRYWDGHPARPRSRLTLPDVPGRSRFVWAGNPHSEIIPYGRWLVPRWQRQQPPPTFYTIVEGESDCWTLWKHGFATLGLPGASMVKVLARRDIEETRALYLLQEPGESGERFILTLAEHLSMLQWRGNVWVIDAELLQAKDPNALYLQDPEAFPVRWLDALSHGKPLAQVLKHLQAAHEQSGGTGEANGDATPQDATQAVDTLLAQLKETPDVCLVFQAMASLARLPTEAWSPLKGQLKQLLGATLNLNDLEKARKEARPRTEPVGDQDRAGASVLAEEIASAWRGRVIFDRTRRRWVRFGFNTEGGRWWEQTEEQVLRKIGHELTEQLPDGYHWSFLQGMERLLRVALEGALATPPRELLPLRNGVLDLRTM